MFKRAAIMLLCLIMVFVATFGFIVGVVAVPTIYSYAAVNDDPIYVPLRDPSDSVIAFQAYCKSRDLTIEGSLTDAVTTFTTGAFNSACNEIGINISELQAEIKAEYDSSGKPVKFFLNDTGVMAMNRIFAQFLQDNELEVGDSISQENPDVLYSGEIFTDADGNNCLVYIQQRHNYNYHLNINDALVYKGTPYFYSNEDIYSWPINSYPRSHTFHLTNQESVSATYRHSVIDNNSYRISVSAGNANNNELIKVMDSQIKGTGDMAIIYTINSQDYGFGWVTWLANNGYKVTVAKSFDNRPSGNLTSCSVYIYTDNSINNNVYEGDTYITNEGDIINNNPDPNPPGGTDPGWDIGGGGGAATDGNGNTWNIQFPDFELPDLNIDWSINGLGEKFPFSIPFDLVALVTVLNAEPQAPRFEGTVNFGFTTWDYDINLQQFDSVAQACRIAELLLLVVRSNNS